MCLDQKRSALVVALGIMLAQCRDTDRAGQAPAPPPPGPAASQAAQKVVKLEPLVNFADAAKLLAKTEATVKSGAPEAPALLQHVWRWTPSEGDQLLVW